MTKNSITGSIAGSDSELGSVTSNRANKLGAILCPAICALLLVSVFAVSFLGTKMAYDQYDSFCANTYDIYRVKEAINVTINDKVVPAKLIVRA